MLILIWVLNVFVGAGQAFWHFFVGRYEISHQRTLVKSECLLMDYIVEHLFLGHESLGPHLSGHRAVPALAWTSYQQLIGKVR